MKELTIKATKNPQKEAGCFLWFAGEWLKIGELRPEVKKMPSVKKGKSRSSYLKRAIPEIRKEGLGQKQAVGKAEGMYDSKWTGRKGKNNGL